MDLDPQLLPHSGEPTAPREDFPVSPFLQLWAVRQETSFPVPRSDMNNWVVTLVMFPDFLDLDVYNEGRMGGTFITVDHLPGITLC